MKKSKQNVKRFFVWLMVLCMLMTQGSVSALAAQIGSESDKSVVETENVTATGITRIQWLQSLTSTFGMSVEKDNYPDNYFADITSDSSYYYDVMLATEFGLIDVEAGDSVYPDAPATREFVAHTFNACMGYVLEDTTYTFAEASSVTYADDIQVAINQGWFTVNAQNQFLPNQQVTSTESAALIALAETEIASREIDENHSDTYVLLDDVIVIPENVEFALVDDGVYELVGLQTTLAVGNKIALISGDLPIVKRITAISSANGVVTVSTESVDVEEAFESINVEGSADADLTQVQAYGENVTLFYIVGGTAEEEYEDGIEYENAEGLDEDDVNAVKVVQTFDIPENVRKEFDIADGVTAEITCYISNPKADYKINLTSPYVNFSCDVTFSCNVSMDVLKAIGVPGTITLARVPVAGIGYIKATLEMSLEGSITLNLVEYVKMGVKWTKSSGFQLTKKFTKKAFTIQAQVDANAGVRLEAGFDVAVLKGEVHGEVGAAVSASSITYGEGSPINCTHMQSWMYAEVGASISLDVIVYEKDWSKSIDIYNRNNSPVRVVFHYEDGVPVGVCTRDTTDDDDDPSNDQYKYYTPADSKYGYSGGSGGVDSEGNEYTIFEYEKITTSTIRLTKYNGNVSALSIPSTMDGYKVTELGSRLFKEHKELMLVVIPDGVKVIGNSAFNKCTSLASVSLPDSIEEIGALAFSECSSLGQVELPDSLEEIGSSAFASCKSLTNVTFAENLTKIGWSAFYNCTSLEKVILPNSLESLGSNAFKDCTSVTEIYIPESLEEISMYSGQLGPFAGCVNVSKITFEDGIESLPGYLFCDCEWLENFEIPDTVKTIGKYLFENCSQLSKVTIPNGITEIPTAAFADCVSLLSIDLPDGIEIIDSSAFSGSGLKEVDFPTALTEISYGAFYGCTSLTKAILPEGLEILGSNAFRNCTALVEVYIPASLEKVTVYSQQFGPFSGCTSLTNIRFGEGIKLIPKCLFMDCEWLEEIVIPDTVETIEIDAFSDCINLSKVTLSKALIKISGAAFSNCESLTNVTFPESLIEIGNSAFYNCADLQKIILPNRLEKLGYGAFRNCKSVTEIYIPKSLQTVGSSDLGIFAGCVSVTNIRLEDGIETIPAYLFGYCEWMENFAVPETVKTIGKYAFEECINLSKITLPKELKVINAGAFSSCESLTNIVLPETLTEIGNSAFSNCESLTEVVIGNKVTNLGISAFSGCTSLEEVTMGYAITQINQSTFYGCESLTSIELLHEVKSIGSSAFAGCESLTEIIIPAKTTSISSNAFTGVENLTIYGVAGSYAQTFAESKGYTFVARNVPIQSLALDITEAVIELKGTLQLGVVANPVNFTDETVWTSSDTTIAKVSDSGLVTAQNKEGVVTITVKAGNYTASCTIKVGNAIEDGLHQAEDGTWYYYLDGKIATDYTGLVEHYGSWFYVENGVLNWGYTGLTCYYGTWYYVEGGVLNWGYTGLTCYYGTWYYVEGGVLNWGYTGLTCYYDTWYYVEGGVLNWNYTGLCEYYGNWYYVEGGVLNWGYTGLTYYYGTWYYVSGGILDWSYTGLVYYYDTWYFVENGMLNWNYTGLVEYYGGWYYVEKSVLYWNYTGLVEYYGGWYYVANSVLDWGYTGTVEYNGALWRVVNGVVVGPA